MTVHYIASLINKFKVYLFSFLSFESIKSKVGKLMNKIMIIIILNIKDIMKISSYNRS